MKTILVLGVLAAGVSTALVGQRSSGGYFGAGFDAVGTESNVYGLSLQGGYVRQSHRFGLRLGATYVERDRTLFSTTAEKIRVVGFNAEVNYELTTGRFRPYLIGGLGLYRQMSSWASRADLYTADGVSPAIIGGLGLRFHVGRLDMYAEARAHWFTNKSVNCGCFVVPVTLGFRF